MPNDIKTIPLNIGITWLYFFSAKNFFKFSVVPPAIINGVIWPTPKKNKKIIEMLGFLACDTHARRVAKTGVMHGEEARPNAPPVI